MSTAVIEVADLDVYYGSSQILFGVALAVRQGETMALPIKSLTLHSQGAIAIRAMSGMPIASTNQLRSVGRE